MTTMSPSKRGTSQSVPQHASQSATQVTVLFVSPSDADWGRFSQIFQHTNWILYRATDYAEATRLLQAAPTAVVVTEEHLPGHRTWLDFLKLTEFCQPLRLIVASESGDVSLWAQVLNLGGYDVLMKPFDSEEVVRVIGLAWRHWKDEWRRGINGNSVVTQQVPVGSR